MKEKITIIVSEYDDKGNIIKKTETITEKEYRDYIYPSLFPTPNYKPTITYLDNPNYKPQITCNFKVGE